MIELPESFNLAKQSKELLAGKIISEVIVLQTPHKFAFFGKTPESIPEQLEGQTIQDAVYHGGLLEYTTEDYSLYFSDGAALHYIKDPHDFPKKHQLAILFDDGSGLFLTIRMYAAMNVCQKGTCTDRYYLSSCQKLNPLDKNFTFDYFMSLVPKDRKISVKALLATEQRIPGLGNGVLQDILWDAGIDPRFPVPELLPDDYKQLYTSVCKILKKMTSEGGRDTEKNLLGENGGYVSQLCSKTLLEPCMKCGGPLQKAAYMGGTVYFCEHCQKKH